jgi:tetratricopeptide (TPR) repeat protein
LELSPGNKNALVERAACYLKTGKNDLALADAEESLKENREFTKGLYQKAEALYAMGEFELALVFFHRGKKLRGDVKEFQLGINKAQEAIDNCVGDPHSVKLEIKGDLSYFDKPDEVISCFFFSIFLFIKMNLLNVRLSSSFDVSF